MDILDRIIVNPQLSLNLSDQLTEQLAWAIASGALQAGDPLPSIRRVAGKFGISIVTVRKSYLALEEKGLVATRQGKPTRVLAYNPIQLVSPPNSIPSNTIGVILPSITNPFYHDLLAGVEELTQPAQALLFVCDTHDKSKEALRFVSQLAAKKVDGIIVASTDVTRPLDILKARSGVLPVTLPLVTVDWPGSSGYVVLADLENASYQATRHLLEHGHRRIGLLTFAFDAPMIRQFNRGYRRALEEAGTEIDPQLVAPVYGFGMDAGLEGMRLLLARTPPPTAIFAVSDMMALGAMRAIQAQGLHIPQDIALIGCNDIPLAGLVSPALTTAAVPGREMGRIAVQMLQCLIAGQQPASQQVLLPTTLVVRQSCGCH